MHRLAALTALLLSCSVSYSAGPPPPRQVRAEPEARPEPAAGKPARRVDPGASSERPTLPANEPPGATELPAAADLVFHGGPVITMRLDPAGDPLVVEALAVDDGEIVAVGALSEVMPLVQADTETVDLAGKALLPGFIGLGAGLSAAALRVDQVQLGAPPLGTVRSIAGLQQALRAEIKQAKLDPGEWVVGWNYDDSALRERRRPTRDDLDAVSTEHPIAVYHRAGRLAIVNTAALRLLRIDADTVDPGGGAIGRRPRSREPNGVLEGTAVVMVDRLVQRLDADELDRRLLTLERDLARRGFTTVQDSPVTPAQLAGLRRLADRGEHLLDVVAYPRIERAADIAGLVDQGFGEPAGRLRLGGVELVLDGSLAARTAWLSKPYTTPPPGKPRGWRGLGLIPTAELHELLELAADQGWQVLARAEGDAAAEQFIDAWEHLLEARRAPDARPVLLGAHLVRDDQLDRMVDAVILPAFASAELYYYGEFHRRVGLGPRRAARLDPARAALDRNLGLALAGDAPAVPLDPALLLSSAVRRTTESGAVLGPGQRIDAFDGLRGLTGQAARHLRLDDGRGSLAVGHAADLVVVDRDPLSSQTGDLTDLRVLTTYKAGAAVFQAPEPLSTRPARPRPRR
jgi:predicted amidohydrolase YtcJ